MQIYTSSYIPTIDIPKAVSVVKIVFSHKDLGSDAIKKCLHGETEIITQYNFRLNVIKQLLHSVTTKQKSHVNPLPADVLRLSDKHFLGKIPIPAGKKKATRNCVVCNPGERKMYKNKNIKPPNRPGRESIYFCKQCEVALCVVPCFELYHSHQDYILKYIELAIF